MNLRIATHAFSDHNRKFFDFLLKVANAQLAQPWQLGDVTHAGVILVDTETPDGLVFWQSHQQSGKLLVAFACYPRPESPWFLEKPLFTVQPLVELLNRLNAVITCPKSRLNEEVFDPADYLPGLIKHGLHENQPVALRVAGYPAVYLLPDSRQCFLPPFHGRFGEAAQNPLYTRRLVEIESSPVSFAEFERHQREHALHAYPLQTLAWLGTLCAGQGRYVKGLSAQTPVRLKYWPNFTLLPYQHGHMRLAAFMTRHTAMPPEIAATTHLPLREVQDFCNACAVLELLRPAATAPVAQTPAVSANPGQDKPLLRKLLERLAIFKF
jgi:hypothetical protein